MNTDTIITEVFLVWDRSRVEHGEAPDLMSVQATEEFAIIYGRLAFETSAHGDCLIERWIMGKDMPEETFILADKLAA